MSTPSHHAKPASPAPPPTMVDGLLRGLTPKQVFVVRMRLGLDGISHAAAAQRLVQFAASPDRPLDKAERESWDPPGASLEAIAKPLGVTRQGAGQLFRSAMLRLRSPHHRRRLAHQLQLIERGDWREHLDLGEMTLAEISACRGLPKDYWKGATVGVVADPEPTPPPPEPSGDLADYLLTTAQAAALTGFSQHCLQLWRVQGKTELPWVRLEDQRSIRYRLGDVVAFARAHQRPARRGRPAKEEAA